jgi:hypothetical protein
MQAFFLTLLLFPSPDNLGHIAAGPPGTSVILEPSMDDVICTQAFLFENLANGLGFSSANSWMLADDLFCVQYGEADITHIELWAIYSSTACTGFNIQLRSDTGGSGPGSISQSTVSSSVEHSNTELYQWGYPLWHTEITLQDDMQFPSSAKYWLVLQTTGGAGAHYWLAADQTWADMTYFSQDNGNTWTSSQAEWGTAYEQFMIVSGMWLSMERESWGSIKALF